MSGLAPEMIADSVVTLAGLVGLLFFAQVLRMQKPRTVVTRRFLFAIHVVAGLLAIRLLQWLTGVEWIGRVTFAVAGVVPLTMLLVAEAMLRRHAPLILKALAAGGALVFALLALLMPERLALIALGALAVFQMTAFVGLAILVLGRDRKSLSIGENTMIDRLALSLVLIVPFALTDFRTEFLDTPVRLSGIAILALCWLGLTLRRNEATQSEIISSAATLGVGLLFAAICIMSLAQLDARTTLQVMAVFLGLGLLALVINQARLIRRADRVARVLDVLADAKVDGHDAFLDALQTRALTSGALILDVKGLADFDAAFRDHFTHQTVISAQTLDQIENPQVAEQCVWFFRKFEASHAMLVSQDPFRVMALNVPALAQSRQLEQELKIAQRLAVLLAEREASHG